MKTTIILKDRKIELSQLDEDVKHELRIALNYDLEQHLTRGQKIASDYIRIVGTYPGSVLRIEIDDECAIEASCQFGTSPERHTFKPFLYYREDSIKKGQIKIAYGNLTAEKTLAQMIDDWINREEKPKQVLECNTVAIEGKQ